MHTSVNRPAARIVTLPTRRAATALAIVGLALLASLPAAAGEAPPTARELRRQRAVLVRRIAELTDTALRSQARAADAAARRRAAADAAESARLNVARYAVDAFVDGHRAAERAQLQRKGWADVISDADRRSLGELRRTQAVARQEERAATDAVAEARRATEQVQFLRTQLERLIAERDAADRAAAEARRLATGTVQLTPRPRVARTTRGQAELFARYPFGPVDGIPAGLAPTGRVVSGPASWYGPGFDGRTTASGAIFDQEGPTVASKELPLGTILLIHHGDRSVLALVNDRGPYVAGRVLDLSHGVANALGTVRAGVARVTAEVLTPIE